MPELPEVETVVRTLGPHLQGRTVTDVTVLRASAIGGPDAAHFGGNLQGERMTDVHRRGKYILIDLASGKQLVVHLRMTGQIAFRPPGTPVSGHTRVVIGLDGGEDLHFIDQRTFGKLCLLPDSDPSPLSGLARLGPEPLEGTFGPQHLRAALQTTRRGVKSALLDQTLVAGIGNIYADEALFAAGIHPEQPAASLGIHRVTRLHAALQDVLLRAIAYKGTTFAHFRNAEGEVGTNQANLAVYGRTQAPCPKCAKPLSRLVLAGRSAHFCQTCQPLMV